MDKMLHQLVTTAFRQSTASIKDPRWPSRIWKHHKIDIKLLGISMPSTLTDWWCPRCNISHWFSVTPTWWGLDKSSLKSMWTQWVYYFRKVASVVPSQQNMLCRDMMETTWTRVWRLVLTILTWHSWDTGIFLKKSGRTQWVKDGEGRFSHEWRFWFSWSKIVSFYLQKCDLAFWVFHWVKGLAWRWHPRGYTTDKCQRNSWIP